MDFYQIATRETKNGFEIFPDFIVGRSKDLMIRSRSVYAVWDEARGLWSTDEYDVQRLVDEEMRAYAATLNGSTTVKLLRSGNSQGWTKFQAHVKNLSDNYHQLDESLTFANQEVRRSDYVSKRLPYSLEPGDYSAWDELMSVLYKPEDREKIEWCIGAIVSGDAKKIQKFLVFYGPAGTGKSTVLNIIEKLFEGYVATFNAKDLGGNNNQFATESFRHNPLVAIQHDGDLSRIEDNTKINSIVSHEPMTMNEKFKPSYTAKVNAFLLMGTNQPVKISDSKSGLLRRLIDVEPSGAKLAANHYHTLMAKIDFELGAIAQHCLEVYRGLGKNYYTNYRPTNMMFQTDPFFNYIEAYFDVFKAQNSTTLKQAYALYKEFCADTGIDKPMAQMKFREELRAYFEEFHDRKLIDGAHVRSYYSGFNASKYKAPVDDNKKIFSLVMEETDSLFDHEYADMPAQYATPQETPKKSWSMVKTTLAEIDTGEVHFVKVPEQHIVIDFDLKDQNGDKSLELNLEAASIWPVTYAEISKSGSGVHLHYNYDGNVNELRRDYSEGIEVKVFTGGSSLRRRLLKCNNVPVATMINTLPLKEKKPVTTMEKISSEKSLRDMIKRNLEKEFHAGTKPSIDFIKHILDGAYEDGLRYDVSDLRPKIYAFANSSSNQPLQSLKVVQNMKWKGKPNENEDVVVFPSDNPEQKPVLFDIEVYPNLFVVCWKYAESPTVVRMVNPSSQEIEQLLKLKLIGFNNRRYDNHILYGALMGYDNKALYELSQKIINGNVGAMFGEAYGLSYADIYDFSSKKQGLKKFGVELGMHHMEMEIPWDEPVPDDMIDKVVEYCVNDVNLTEAVLADREQDFVARQILAELSGLTVNDPTPKHTARIIFGKDRDAQKSFVYTDLREMFPGYSFDLGKSIYRSRFAPEGAPADIPGEGGYVYAEPGMYENVALLDVASMHPTSIRELNLFGEYTPNFTQLLDARLAIKAGDFDKARTMLGGRLAPYLKDKHQAKDLSYALKIVINIVYGMTSARFDNPFRDLRNKDNIVAKRGALFMIDLKHAVQAQGFTVAHIKTDSIKIPNATPEIIQFVTEFGKQYGYDFEHEATYDAFCLVNDAVYIAREGSGENAHYTAVGAQFQHPYVYKTLFSEEDIRFEDLCETKQVTKGAIYLDFKNGFKPGPDDIKNMHFVGRTGRFVPVAPESGIGGTLYRISEEKFYAVSGTKGYQWAEAEVVQNKTKAGEEVEIDMTYFERLVQEARDTIDHYGPYSVFTGERV
jgi:DNA polymerase III delta prime subunit